MGPITNTFIKIDSNYFPQKGMTSRSCTKKIKPRKKCPNTEYGEIRDRKKNSVLNAFLFNVPILSPRKHHKL